MLRARVSELEAALSASNARCADHENVIHQLSEENGRLNALVADLTAQLNEARAHVSRLEVECHNHMARVQDLES